MTICIYDNVWASFRGLIQKNTFYKVNQNIFYSFITFKNNNNLVTSMGKLLCHPHSGVCYGKFNEKPEVNNPSFEQEICIK